MTPYTLVMMVKDEAETLEATLRSVFSDPRCKRLTLLDTGSTDATVGIAEDVCDLLGVSFDLHRECFVDYGATRNRALHLAARSTDGWQLMLSGGEVVECPPSYLPSEPLPHERLGYVYFKLGQARHASIRWTFAHHGHVSGGYIGKTHEVIAPPPGSIPFDSGMRLDHQKTARDARKDIARWQKDVQLLLPSANDGDPRSMFYLAQSYELLGDFQQARYWYRERQRAEGFWEERYIAATRLVKSLPTVLSTEDKQWMEQTLRVWMKKAPRRLELAFACAEVLARTEDWPAVLMLSLYGQGLQAPKDALLEIMPDVYRWRFAELGARAAWYLGRHDVARALFAEAKSNAPADEPLIVQNAKFYQDK